MFSVGVVGPHLPGKTFPARISSTRFCVQAHQNIRRPFLSTWDMWRINSHLDCVHVEKICLILTSGENLLVPAFVLEHIQLLDFISKARFAPTRALYD